MRNRLIPVLLLGLALTAAASALADDSPPAAPAAAQPAETLLPDALDDALLDAAPNATPAAPEADLLDPTHGAQPMAICWIESRTTYPCTCNGGTRRKELNQERQCCESGPCSGWWTVSSSCTNFPC